MVTPSKHVNRNDLHLRSIPSSLSICPYLPSLDGRYAEGCRPILTPVVAVVQDRYTIDSSRVAFEENEMGLSVLFVSNTFNSKHKASKSFGGARLFGDIEARVEFDASSVLLPCNCYSQSVDACIRGPHDELFD
ncbi:hypothetical protein IG631_23489 [Alternaria alternata]|nr:hypothetical protein IG631_23489 [Alternaria alternata]